MGLNVYGDSIRNTTREVPPPAVIQFTLDDLDTVAEELAYLDGIKDDFGSVAAENLTRALGVLEYRRHLLARWVRQHNTDEPALRAARRTEA